MEINYRMTREAIHDFGVQIVSEAMARNGYEILGANPAPSVAPQIVAQKNGQLCFVLVRTDLYPKKGALTDEREVRHNLEHAERHNAVCYFASVGIRSAAPAEAGDKETTAAPAGGGFYVDFDGLRIMTTIDRVVMARTGGEPPGKDGVERVEGSAG